MKYLIKGRGVQSLVKQDDRLATNPGIDAYIGLTTNCNDAEDKRSNFGKLFLFVCS
jgi:hypothetical protein